MKRKLAIVATLAVGTAIIVRIRGWLDQAEPLYPEP